MHILKRVLPYGLPRLSCILYLPLGQPSPVALGVTLADSIVLSRV